MIWDFGDYGVAAPWAILRSMRDGTAFRPLTHRVDTCRSITPRLPAPLRLLVAVLAAGIAQALCVEAMAAPPGAPATYQASTTPTSKLVKLAHRAKMISTGNLCMNAGSNSECEAAFAAALRSSTALGASMEPADVVVSASAPAMVGPRGAEPLHFQKRAPWVRRLETIGKEGIPFVRVPRGPDSELVVGINRKGVLGFSLKQTSTR